MESVKNKMYNIIAVEQDNFIEKTLEKNVEHSKYCLKKFSNINNLLDYNIIKDSNIIIIDCFDNLDENEINIIKQISSQNSDLSIILVLNILDEKIDISKLDNVAIQGFCGKNQKLNQLPIFVNNSIKLFDHMNMIQKINDELLNSKERLVKSYLESIEILRYTVEAKDTYTRGHSERVAEYAVLIGEKLGLSKEELRTLQIGGLFHDIGKIGIPDSILLKTEKLTDNEYEQIKKHPLIGKEILSNASIFQDIIPIVLYHHERYDGKGYPESISGENIPLLARIVCVADSFDAMTSKRSYRDELDLNFVISEIENQSGTQFDPKISEIFLNILKNEQNLILNIKNRF